MAITLGGKTFETILDPLYINGKKVQKAYCNGNLVYPSMNTRGAFRATFHAVDYGPRLFGNVIGSTSRNGVIGSHLPELGHISAMPSYAYLFYPEDELTHWDGFQPIIDFTITAEYYSNMPLVYDGQGAWFNYRGIEKPSAFRKINVSANVVYDGLIPEYFGVKGYVGTNVNHMRDTGVPVGKYYWDFSQAAFDFDDERVLYVAGIDYHGPTEFEITTNGTFTFRRQPFLTRTGNWDAQAGYRALYLSFCIPLQIIEATPESYNASENPDDWEFRETDGFYIIRNNRVNNTIAYPYNLTLINEMDGVDWEIELLSDYITL